MTLRAPSSSATRFGGALRTGEQLWAPVLQSASVGAVNRFAVLAIRVVTIPIVLRYLGTERYGLWITLASATAYITLLDLGASSALVNQLTHYYERGQVRRASVFLLATATTLLGIAVSVFSAGLVALRSIDLPRALHLVTPEAVADARPTVVTALLFASLQLVAGVVLKVPYTMHEGRLAEAYQLAGNLVGFAGVLAGVHFDLKLPFLAAALMAPPLLAAFGIALQLGMRGQLQLVAPRRRCLVAVGSILRRTAPTFAVMQGAAALLVALQFSLLAVYRGAAAVAPYGLMSQILLTLQVPLSVLQQPLWTRLASLYYGRAAAAIRRVILQYLRVALVYSLFAGAAMVFLTNPALSVIMRHPMTIGWDLRVTFAVLCGLGLVAGGNLGSVLYAMDLSSSAAGLVVAQLVVFVVLAVLLTPAYGAAGTALSVLAIYLLAIPVQIRLIRTGLQRAAAGPAPLKAAVPPAL